MYEDHDHEMPDEVLQEQADKALAEAKQRAEVIEGLYDFRKVNR